MSYDSTGSKAKLLDLDRIAWDDLRFFTSSARYGSFRAAAAAVDVSPSTLLRRIEFLEEQLGAELFIRSSEGITLSDFGSEVLIAVSPMRAPLQDLKSVLERRKTGRTSISIATTEGMGMQWLVPSLSEILTRHADLRIDIRMSMSLPDLLRHEADIGVHVIPQSAFNIAGQKIGRMHYSFYASEDYLAQNGTPKSVEDLQNHRLIDQIDSVFTDGQFNAMLGGQRVQTNILACMSGSIGNIVAVEAGLGIGVLPTYSVPFGRHVVPIDLGTRRHSEIYMTWRPEFPSKPKAEIVIDWLKRLYDPKRYPWFSDEYVDPKAFKTILIDRQGRRSSGKAFL